MNSKIRRQFTERPHVIVFKVICGATGLDSTECNLFGILLRDCLSLVAGLG